MLIGALGLAAAPATTESVTPVTIAAVGDIVCDPDLAGYANCDHPATAQLVTQQAASAVIVLGDAQYETGNQGDYADAYDKTWGQFKSFTYPVVGNHEYKTYGATGFYDYFGARVPGGAPGWYAFSVGGWRFYALNTNCGLVNCTTERDWMVADVAANPAACQAILMHHPRYSSGQHGSSTIPGRFWVVALRNHFELALAGHDHDYERFTKMDAAGNQTTTGLRSFVAGTGGKELYQFGVTQSGSRVRYNANYGVLFLDVTPTDYTWRYINIGGTVIDSGSDTCR